MRVADWKESAGLIAAPLAWLITTQLGQILPYVDCTRHTSFALVAVLAGTAMSLAGVIFTYPMQWHRLSFIAGLSLGLTQVFTVALMLQGLAVMMLDPCQR